MRKKNIANLVMVILIVVIAAAGILGVGHIQGWFDTADGTQAVLQDIRGVIDLHREGVRYPVTQHTVLRSGDMLSCQSGAVAVLIVGNDRVVLGEKASVTVQDPTVDAFRLQVHSGEVFAHCDTPAVLSFADTECTVQQATVLLSIQSGAQSLSVLRGTVDGVTAGQMLQFIGGEKSTSTLALESLNDFTVSQIRNLDDPSLCFTVEDLDKLAADRQHALENLINGPTLPSVPATSSESTSPAQDADPTKTTQPDRENATPAPSSAPSETTVPPAASVPPETTALPDTTMPAETKVPETTVPPDPTAPEETTPPDTTSPAETIPPDTTAPAATNSCTIAIYCYTILDNMADLEPGKAEFVPDNGVILSAITVNFADGETVFDVLKRVCNRAGIQIEYSWTPLYNSYYVEGIHNLYEFDCGFESGWMYLVNGWFPNYGCSSYTLQDGDVIVWNYTCEGLGTDIGAPRMD